MSTKIFGVGELFAKDSAGNAHKFGTLQEVTVDFQASTKPLYGSNSYPEDVAVTEKKISGKAKFATIDGKMLASIMSGSRVSGRRITTTVITGSAASVTVPTGTGFAADYGVWDSLGNPMTLTSSAPAVGAYAVATGTGAYTFNAGQTGNVSISYAYNTGSGYTTTVSNTPMGAGNTYEMNLYANYKGEGWGFRLYAAMIPAINIALKNTDHAMQDLTFEAQADTSGRVYDFIEDPN